MRSSTSERRPAPIPGEAAVEPSTAPAAPSARRPAARTRTTALDDSLRLRLLALNRRLRAQACAVSLPLPSVTDYFERLAKAGAVSIE